MELTFPIPIVKDANKLFKCLGFNTTNPDMLDDYDKTYKDMVAWFRECAIKWMHNDGCLKAYFEGDNTLLALACDYLMQQVHLKGYEKVKFVLNEAQVELEKMDGNSLRRYNLYRQFYEHQYCSDDELCFNVEKFISRDAYDKVKEYCAELDNPIPEGVDFFVDYALFVKMWNCVRGRKEYFFKEKDDGKRNDLLFSGNDSNQSDLVLHCITQEGNFDNEYRFRVVKCKNDVNIGQCPSIVLKIDFEKETPSSELEYEVHGKGSSSSYCCKNVQKACIIKINEEPFSTPAGILDHHGITIQ